MAEEEGWVGTLWVERWGSYSRNLVIKHIKVGPREEEENVIT